MNVETDAIVIKKKKVASTDVIITILSKEYGKKSVYVKGARHTKSKFSAYTELFTEAKFSLYIKKNLCNLNSVDSITAHSKLRNEMSRLFVGTYLLELVDIFIAEDDGDIRLYDMLSYALKFLEEDEEENFLLLRTMFFIKLLKLLGYAPEVSMCVECLTVENIKYFGFSSGGIICDKCGLNVENKVDVDYEYLRIINILLKKSYLSVRNMDISGIILDKIDSNLFEFIKRHLVIRTIQSRQLLLDMKL